MVNAYRKGVKGELMFRDLVNGIFGWTNEEGVKRTPNSGGLCIKSDLIQLRGILKDFSFEVKNEAKPRLWAYVKQAEEDASYTRTPVVAIHRPGTKDYYCVTNARFFFSMLKELGEFREKESKAPAELGTII